MDAEIQLLPRFLNQPDVRLSASDRTAIDRMLEWAIIDDEAMAELLTVLENQNIPLLTMNWFRWQWVRSKSIRWGIQSLSQTELAQILSAPDRLKAIANSVSAAFNRDGGSKHWWNVRVEAASAFLIRMGLAKSHRDAIQRHTAHLKHH